MTKLLFTLSIMFFSLPMANEKWLNFKSVEGRFKLEVPGKFKEVINKANTALGELEYHVFVYRDNDKDADNMVYMVSYCDYPDSSIHSDSTELVNEFLLATVDQSVESVKGKLIYSAESNFEGYPGRIWRTDYGNGEGVIRTKAFIKGKRFYSIQTVCTKDKSLNFSSDKFFDSFKLFSPKESIK